MENPLEVAFRERLESVSRLEEENDRLRARVKVLEEFGCSQDVTAQVQLRLDQDGSLPDRKSEQNTFKVLRLCDRDEVRRMRGGI